jgi:hypothetical protein
VVTHEENAEKACGYQQVIIYLSYIDLHAHDTSEGSMTSFRLNSKRTMIVALLLLLIAGNAHAFDLLFFDDFDGDSLEQWKPVLGEWAISDGSLCALECPS